MRIGQKAEYAVRAVLDLALHARPDADIRSAEVARRTGVPEKFLEAILLQLRRAEVVASRRGPEGGHRLARDPSMLTVGAIVTAIDGSLSEARGRRAPRASTPAEACLQALWARVEQAVHDVVETVTIEDLRRQAAPEGALDFCI